MEISSIRMDGSQPYLLDQVGTAMLSKGLKADEQQAADIMRSLPPAPLPEGSGERVDLFA
jgi:hypothetical protein